jgi:transcriptional regulator GlxA family with amidase domain
MTDDGLTQRRHLTLPAREPLDFAGPSEVIWVASRWSDPLAFCVWSVAEKPGPVLIRNGLNVHPYPRLSDCPPIDLLVVPGGLGTC